MADGFLETEEQEKKRLKKHFDRLGYIADADWGYPEKCPCGSHMVMETTDEPTLGRKYWSCNAFENDGLHFRKPWEHAVEEELGILRRAIDKIRGHQDLVELEMRMELEKNAKEIAQLKEIVGDLMGRIEK